MCQHGRKICSHLSLEPKWYTQKYIPETSHSPHLTVQKKTPKMKQAHEYEHRTIGLAVPYGRSFKVARPFILVAD